MDEIKSFRDLLIWQKSMQLVTDLYSITKLFPNEELYGLVQQIRRAAISIPSNIAEGYGRNSTKDYIRFLRIARGSIYELQTQLEISANLKYIAVETYSEHNEKLQEIERMVSSLIKKIS